jgi:predicted RND superfamily exporter protein
MIAGLELAAAELRALLRREIAAFLAGALALNLALVLAFERSLARSIRLLAPTVVALVATLGGMGLAGIAVDPVNVIALPLLIGLGVDGTVYLVAHERHAALAGEAEGRGLGPLLLASGTTIVGFGSLALSEFPALATLGLLAATGLALSTVATLVLVPAMGKLGSPP